MPAHDWTRVDAGTFHAFHLGWMAELQKSLNNGILPSDFYALAEQLAGNVGPDVLTLQAKGASDHGSANSTNGKGGVVVAPPQVRFTARVDGGPYTRKARQLVIRHASDDRVVALLEILSPGNKRTRAAMRRFVDKAFAVVDQGFHLVIVDLFPPGPGDPQGVHGALWADLGGEAFIQPKDKPLTLAAYAAAEPITCFVEPFSVGDVLVDMPLFLDAEAYVNVPLEITYQAAWAGVPRRWRGVLETRS